MKKLSQTHPDVQGVSTPHSPHKNAPQAILRSKKGHQRAFPSTHEYETP